jgi:hypothetical protein
MKNDRFVMTGAARVIEEALNSIHESPRRLHSCDILLLWQSASGSGLSTALQEITTVAGWPLVHIRAEPTPRTIVADMFRATHRYEDSYYGSDQTRFAVERRLAEEGQPLIVFDNCERLTPRMLDIVRDTGDSTGCPIALSGAPRIREILFSSKTSLLEPVRDRVRLSVELPRPSLKDARLLASELLEIQVDNDLIGHTFKRAGQSMRSLLAALHDIEKLALVTGLQRIGLTRWFAITGEPATAELPEAKLIETLPARRAEVA